MIYFTSRGASRLSSPAVRLHPRSSILALLVLSASACVTAGPTAPAGADPGAASGTSTVERTEVVCEYVRPSGSNIMERQCREVRRDTDGSGTRGSENWFRPPPPTPSR